MATMLGFEGEIREELERVTELIIFGSRGNEATFSMFWLFNVQAVLCSTLGI